MEHSRNDYVKYRLEKANETFLASKNKPSNVFKTWKRLKFKHITGINNNFQHSENIY